MSTKSAPYYWLICDVCGEKSTEGGEYTAWQSLSDAEEDALCSDWRIDDGQHFCPDCQICDDETEVSES